MSERSGDVRARRVFVRGLVQGVAFRYHAREEARARGVTGWVRNLHDGRVEALCEGDPARVEAFLGWLRRGPPAARVEGIEVHDSVGEGGVSFEIRR